MKQTAEEFVKAWQSSNNASEVAHKLKVSKNSVHSRALLFRKNGVPLKKFKRGTIYDWAALIELAKSIKTSS